MIVIQKMIALYQNSRPGDLNEDILSSLRKQNRCTTPRIIAPSSKRSGTSEDRNPTARRGDRPNLLDEAVFILKGKKETSIGQTKMYCQA